MMKTLVLSVKAGTYFMRNFILQSSETLEFILEFVHKRLIGNAKTQRLLDKILTKNIFNFKTGTK